MKILITGAGGQMGRTFLSMNTGDTFTAAPSIREHGMSYVYDRIAGQHADVVINCAAWTDVAGAEKDRVGCYELNARWPEWLARLCCKAGIPFVTYSTDYVFNGKKGTPYTEEDAPDPLNVYGASKLEGERAVMLVNPDALIIRTAGLYSPYGKNFVKTILGRLAEGQPFPVESRFVTNLTDAESLAAVTIAALNSRLSGVWHYQNSPSVTWYKAACCVKWAAGSADMPPRVIPLPRNDGVTRPEMSALDRRALLKNAGFQPPRWREQLQNTVKAVLAAAITGPS